MSSRRRSGVSDSREGVDVGDAVQLVARGLAQLQEALRLQSGNGMQEALRLQQQAERKVQEAERKAQDAVRLHKQEAERRVQDALRLQRQEAEKKFHEVLRLQKQEAERKVLEAERRMKDALHEQEQRAAWALREMKQKLHEKEDAILALQHRLRETQQIVKDAERRPWASVECGGTGGLQRLEGCVEKMEASLQSAVQKFMPRVETLLRQLEESQYSSASLATAASVREASTTGEAAAGGGEGPPSSTSGAGHQGAAADEEERERQRVKRLVQEVKLRMEKARDYPCALDDLLCKAAATGNLRDVRRFIDSNANLNYTDRDGFTPLHHAATAAHPDAVSLLLRRGADVNAVDGDGNTALHWAAETDRSGRCVGLLVGAGCNVDAWNADDKSALNIAWEKKNRKAMAALFRPSAGPYVTGRAEERALKILHRGSNDAQNVS